MSDDLLKQAARSLRHETGDEDSGKFTRARVMATLHQSQVRRRTRLAFALPLAASFAAATAWGTVSGRAPEIARTVVQALGFSVKPVETPAPAPRSKPRRPKALAAAPTATALTPAPSPESEPLEPVAPEVAEPQKPAPVRATSSASARATERDPAHELYRAAHRLHFAEQNCGQAVEAWSAYLRAAPAGRFAPEARYNRALCLVRLGRREQASEALAPFARGQYGTYRQRDAQALLNALQD